MGWASGSELMSGIIGVAQDYIPDEEERSEFYKKIIRLMESHDCDTLYECVGEDDAYDEAHEDLYPSEDDEDEEDDSEDVFERFEGVWQDDYPDDPPDDF